MVGYIINGNRYNYCSLCYTVYKVLPGYKLEMIANTKEESKRFLGLTDKQMLEIK